MSNRALEWNPANGIEHTFAAEEISRIKEQTKHLRSFLPCGQTHDATIDGLFIDPWSVNKLVALRKIVNAPGVNTRVYSALDFLGHSNMCRLICRAIDVAISILEEEIGDQ